MGDNQQISFTFSYELRLYYTFPLIHLRIRRPPNYLIQIRTQIPLTTNAHGSITTSAQRLLQSTLTHHQIQEAEAVRLLRLLDLFVTSSMLSGTPYTTTQLALFITVILITIFRQTQGVTSEE